MFRDKGAESEAGTGHLEKETGFRKAPNPNSEKQPASDRVLLTKLAAGRLVVFWCPHGSAHRRPRRSLAWGRGEGAGLLLPMKPFFKSALLSRALCGCWCWSGAGYNLTSSAEPGPVDPSPS